MKILYAEDHSEKYMDVVMALKSQGIKGVKWVESVSEAVDAALREEGEGGFDVVLTDMEYPLTPNGSSSTEAGINLIRRLKEERINVPVVVLSSHNYEIPEAYASVWYSSRGDWERKLAEIIRRFSQRKESEM